MLEARRVMRDDLEREGSPLMVKKTLEDMPVRVIDGVRYRCINDLLFESTSYKVVELDDTSTKKQTNEYKKQLVETDKALIRKLKQASKGGEDMKKAIYEIVWSGYTPKQVAVLLRISEKEVQRLYHEAKHEHDENEASRKPAGTNKEEYRKIMRLRVNGVAAKEMAEIMDREPESIRSRLVVADNYIKAYEEYMGLSDEERELVMDLYKEWGYAQTLRVEVRKVLGKDIDVRGAIKYMTLLDMLEEIELGTIYDEVYGLYEEGRTYKEVGEVLGRSESWAYGMVRAKKEQLNGKIRK